MRVESESTSSLKLPPPTGVQWAPPSPNDRESLWPPPPDGLLQGFHPPLDVQLQALHEHLHSPYPLDPTLHREPDSSLDPAFAIGPANSFRQGITASGSRTRTDLLSPNAAALFRAATTSTHSEEPSSAAPSSPSSPSMPRLPPILQVEKKTVTTSATQAASASRRRNEALYQCPVPGCGSTFTRRFNLRGHLRSHTEERPYVCEWPGCGKGFARQHDCKRHYALHVPRTVHTHTCRGCNKTFSRMDALNRHLRSDNGAECREKMNIGTVNPPEGQLEPVLADYEPDIKKEAPSQAASEGPSTSRPSG